MNLFANLVFVKRLFQKIKTIFINNKNEIISDIKVCNRNMIRRNVDWLQLRPFAAKSVLFSLLSTFFDFLNEGKISFSSNKLETLECSLSFNDIFFIVNDFVFNVEDKFFNFFTLFLTFFKDFVFLIIGFFVIVAVY